MSIALFFVFHDLQSSDFNKKFNESLNTIPSGNLGDELPNKNVLKLLLLLFIALILLLKSPDKSRIAFFCQKTDELGFDSCSELFLLDISLLILLSITFFKLFL